MVVDDIIALDIYDCFGCFQERTMIVSWIGFNTVIFSFSTYLYGVTCKIGDALGFHVGKIAIGEIHLSSSTLIYSVIGEGCS
jgi:hypothetical protein